MRSLAQRAAVAAKEIKELIAASVDTVDIGAKLVDSAGETTRKIAVAIEKSALLMSQISAASAETSRRYSPISRVSPPWWRRLSRTCLGRFLMNTSPA